MDIIFCWLTIGVLTAKYGVVFGRYKKVIAKRELTLNGCIWLTLFFWPAIWIEEFINLLFVFIKMGQGN